MKWSILDLDCRPSVVVIYANLLNRIYVTFCGGQRAINIIFMSWYCGGSKQWDEICSSFKEPSTPCGIQPEKCGQKMCLHEKFVTSSIYNFSISLKKWFRDVFYLSRHFSRFSSWLIYLHKRLSATTPWFNFASAFFSFNIFSSRWCQADI